MEHLGGAPDEERIIAAAAPLDTGKADFVCFVPTPAEGTRRKRRRRRPPFDDDPLVGEAGQPTRGPAPARIRRGGQTSRRIDGNLYVRPR